MLRLIGLILGIGSISFLSLGAIAAYQKVVMDSSDMLLIGFTLMMVATFIFNVADRGSTTNGNNSSKESTLSK